VIGILLITCVVMAVVKFLIVALVIAFAIALLWATIKNPGATIAYVLVCTACAITGFRPMLAVVILGLGAAIWKNE